MEMGHFENWKSLNILSVELHGMNVCITQSSSRREEWVYALWVNYVWSRSYDGNEISAERKEVRGCEWNTFLVLFEDDTLFIIMEYPTSYHAVIGSQSSFYSDLISIGRSPHSNPLYLRLYVWPTWVHCSLFARDDLLYLAVLIYLHCIFVLFVFRMRGALFCVLVCDRNT